MIPSLTNANDQLIVIAGKSMPLRFRPFRSLSRQRRRGSGLARNQKAFTDGDTRSSGEIGLRPILNDPAALLEEVINLLPSPLFGVM
jgi:hypothetical protein